MAHPDRAVRFHAAFALARANPTASFPSFFNVTRILAEAVGTTATPSVLLVAPTDNQRNSMSDALRASAAHYVVYAGNNLSSALDQARKAPGFDMIIIPFNQAEIANIGAIAKTDYRLAGVPVLVTAATAQLNTARNALQSAKGCEVIDDHSDVTTITNALNHARIQTGATAISADDAGEFSLSALKILDTLAVDHRSIYPVNECAPVVIDALLKDKRPDVVSAAATFLGKLNNPDAQRALATAALSPEATPEMRIHFFDQLAESGKRSPNTLDTLAINGIIKTVASDSDVKVRFAAAGALGALNVPSNQASTLILHQAR
jgi:CheY-like chemotaxis protein